jgi:magnesium chelatase subunit I
VPEQAGEWATGQVNFPLLPYSYVVGQDELREMLKIAYVMGSSVGGVLLSGERGTAKSTIARSFAYMMHSALPTTLPINATDDRVMGGWNIDALMKGNPVPKEGLLKQANKTGMLYIDEVNLLDDHIVNLILDAVSTGVLDVQRDGIDDPQDNVSFMLVGTMNPDEGSLRPQMLDRFGLFVPVKADRKPEIRAEILERVLRFDTERGNPGSDWLERGKRQDQQQKNMVNEAKRNASRVEVTDETIKLCARVAAEFDAVGHRAEIVIAKAARAHAAFAGRGRTEPRDVREIAPYAIMHRRRDASYAEGFDWVQKDKDLLKKLIPEE